MIDGANPDFDGLGLVIKQTYYEQDGFWCLGGLHHAIKESNTLDLAALGNFRKKLVEIWVKLDKLHDNGN